MTPIPELIARLKSAVHEESVLISPRTSKLIEEVKYVIGELEGEAGLPAAGWQPIETAPKDGAQILGIYDNGCGWEFRLVYWVGGDYPWQVVDGGRDNAWAEGRIDYWRPFPETPPTSMEIDLAREALPPGRAPKNGNQQ